jgi:hypothetical protein
MRWVTLSGVAAAIILSSCATYQGANITGEWKDVSRADIAAAVEAARADPHLKRAGDTLSEIAVISREEIRLVWASKEIDTMERVRGKWQCGITRITAG